MESVNKKETAGESERAKTCEQLGWSGKAPVVDTEAKKEIKFKYRRTVEATLLIVIAVAIWGLFSLPSLLYLKRNVANKVCVCVSCVFRDDNVCARMYPICVGGNRV